MEDVHCLCCVSAGQRLDGKGGVGLLLNLGILSALLFLPWPTVDF